MTNFAECREVRLPIGVRCEVNSWLNHLEAECRDLEKLPTHQVKAEMLDMKPHLERRARQRDLERQVRDITHEQRRAIRRLRLALQLEPPEAG